MKIELEIPDPIFRALGEIARRRGYTGSNGNQFSVWPSRHAAADLLEMAIISDFRALTGKTITEWERMRCNGRPVEIGSKQ